MTAEQGVTASRFARRVAIVTGAAQGIGAATARRLAAEGATVAVLDRNEEGATATAEAIVAAGGDAFGLGCDVSSAESVATAVDEVVSRHGHLDVLVNNAGVTRDNLLFKMDEDDWTTPCCRSTSPASS